MLGDNECRYFFQCHYETFNCVIIISLYQISPPTHIEFFCTRFAASAPARLYCFCKVRYCGRIPDDPLQEIPPLLESGETVQSLQSANVPIYVPMVRMDKPWKLKRANIEDLGVLGLPAGDKNQVLQGDVTWRDKTGSSQSLAYDIFSKNKIADSDKNLAIIGDGFASNGHQSFSSAQRQIISGLLQGDFDGPNEKSSQYAKCSFNELTKFSGIHMFNCTGDSPLNQMDTTEEYAKNRWWCCINIRWLGGVGTKGENEGEQIAIGCKCEMLDGESLGGRVWTRSQSPDNDTEEGDWTEWVELANNKQINELKKRIEAVEILGDFAGSFEKHENLPESVSEYEDEFGHGISKNDFATVRNDESGESYKGATTRWIVTDIDDDDITWAYDLTYSTDITGKFDQPDGTEDDLIQGDGTLVSKEDLLGDYLPLAGGTMSGTINWDNSGTDGKTLLYATMGDNDHARICVGAASQNQGFLEISTADDGSEPIYIRQYSGTFATLKRELTLLDGQGDTEFPGNVDVGKLLSILSASTSKNITKLPYSNTGQNQAYASYENMNFLEYVFRLLRNNSPSERLSNNLNDAVWHSNYFFGGTETNGLQNKPAVPNTVSDIWLLNVPWNISGGWCLQAAFSPMSEQIFMRYRNGSNWYDWTEMANKSDIPSVTNKMDTASSSALLTSNDTTETVSNGRPFLIRWRLRTFNPTLAINKDKYKEGELLFIHIDNDGVYRGSATIKQDGESDINIPFVFNGNLGTYWLVLLFKGSSKFELTSNNVWRLGNIDLPSGVAQIVNLNKNTPSNSIDSATLGVEGILPIEKGGTGSNDIDTARNNLQAAKQCSKYTNPGNTSVTVLRASDFNGYTLNLANLIVPGISHSHLVELT